MSTLSDLINSDAVKRLLSDTWDGTPVQYMHRYEIERLPLTCPLLQRLELPDRNVIMVQPFRKNSHRNHMTRSKSSGSSTLYIDDDDSYDEGCLAELTGCPLEWNPTLNTQTMTLLESPPYDSQINSPCTPGVAPSSFLQGSATNGSSANPSNSVMSPLVQLRALPADEASSVLNSLSSVLANSVASTPDGPPRQVPPVWIPCDGADPQYTAFLGQHRAEGVASRVVVTCRGPVESKDLPTYGCILRKHFWGLSQHHCHTTTQLSSRYDVLNIYSLSEPRFASSANDVMQIDCCWNGRATHLLQGPVIDAVCHLTVQISPGNEKSPCRSIYKELVHLQNLVNCLSSGEMSWQKDFSSPPFMEKVKNVCKGARTGAIKPTNNVKQSALDAAWDMADFNICIETVVASKRQAVDFTDELWTVIYGCANYQELKDALSYVFNQVQSGQIKPYIAPNNNTQMASVLRDMSAQLCSEPTLQGVAPLTLVAEMGLQKLQRDYLHVFSGLELASAEQLSPFFRGTGPLRGLTELGAAVSELMKVQAVLDMVMLCKTNLHLPIHYLSGYAREALKQSGQAEPKPPQQPPAAYHRFRFPLKVALVRAILDSLPPTEWTASIKSRQGAYTAHTITHISQRAPFHHLSRDTTYEAHYNPRDPDYFCTLVSCTQDKLR
ncbi:protein zwilch homolog [Galendromus occidentalis]|uniref:Protein zwilch n=1 Tax=Galendromus occidentalis TaxID=34638 RepID=A0AAJ6QQD5_9ACAR|nr:protein zwilch homolog [Galendromus occidentalis]